MEFLKAVHVVIFTAVVESHGHWPLMQLKPSGRDGQIRMGLNLLNSFNSKDGQVVILPPEVKEQEDRTPTSELAQKSDFSLNKLLHC